MLDVSIIAVGVSVHVSQFTCTIKKKGSLKEKNVEDPYSMTEGLYLPQQSGWPQEHRCPTSYSPNWQRRKQKLVLPRAGSPAEIVFIGWATFSRLYRMNAEYPAHLVSSTSHPHDLVRLHGLHAIRDHFVAMGTCGGNNAPVIRSFLQLKSKGSQTWHSPYCPP